MVPPKDNQGTRKFITILKYSGENEAVGHINSITYLDWRQSTLILSDLRR